jgi:hypothetical protein
MRSPKQTARRIEAREPSRRKTGVLIHQSHLRIGSLGYPTLFGRCCHASNDSDASAHLVLSVATSRGLAQDPSEPWLPPNAQCNATLVARRNDTEEPIERLSVWEGVIMYQQTEKQRVTVEEPPDFAIWPGRDGVKVVICCGALRASESERPGVWAPLVRLVSRAVATSAAPAESWPCIESSRDSMFNVDAIASCQDCAPCVS